MKIRFFNAKILTFTDEYTIIEGELWVQGNRITYIGKNGENKREESPKISTDMELKNKLNNTMNFDREIDVKGNLLLPGFKNAHTHSAMTFLRSYADDLPLLDWLQKQVFPMEAKLTGEDIYHLSKLAILEYLSSGMTANFDMYFCPEDVSQASIDMGFRTVMCGGISNFTGSVDENVTNLENWFKKYNSHNELIGYRLGFHAEYTADRPLLEGIAELARKYKAPVFTHLSESKAEVDQCIERNGITPPVYLDSFGMFEYGGGGYHCVHMSDEDLKVFHDKSLFVITNPGSNSKLASGIAPIVKMMNMGINLAIGTDGPASNNCLDMFREMYLTTALQKLKEHDAAAVDANKVLYMATVGGANAMGLEDCDTLEVGKIADIIMIDLHQPNMQPINNITKNIVYSGCKQNVKMTMINGRILYEDNNFYVGEDVEKIYVKANEIINSMR
jgi:5-methylthioadenosine/S-adenosylhomocysteine deaminase